MASGDIYNALNNVPQVTPGSTFVLADQWNSYVRNNFDALKSGHIVCSSTDRPSAAVEGTMIYESDTNRVLVRGDSDWVEVSGLGNTGAVSSVAAPFLVPVGSILPYGGSTNPSGWLICNGASVSRSTYASLFNVIGTRYGSVDGSSFTLPSFNGRVPLGIVSGSPTVPTTVATSNTIPNNHQHGGVSTGGGTTFGVDGGAGVLEHSHTVDAVQLLFIIKH